MPEIDPQHIMSYRKEILRPLFSKIQSADSCVVIGAASMGKTRLLERCMRPDVQQYYLGELADQMLFVRMDSNRMYKPGMGKFYELLLTSLSQACGQHAKVSAMQLQINNLLAQVINSENALMALRFFELAVNQICAGKDSRICFLFDEFDNLYRDLDKEVFAQLRAVRDANKGRLSYVLFLRSTPQRLRDPHDNEAFYELFSRSLLVLTPYTNEDSQIIFDDLEKRRQQSFPPERKNEMLVLCGGHVGLLLALMDVMNEHMDQPDCLKDLEWLSNQPRIIEECRKMWEGLMEDERFGLIGIVKDVDIPPDVLDVLRLSGLVHSHGGRDEIFTPLLEIYVSQAWKPK